MRALIKLFIPVLVMISACTFPKPGQSTPGGAVTIEPAPTEVASAQPQESDSIECGYVWAREPLPDLSKEFDAALKEVLPQASGHAEAYGENCLNNQGEAVRFLAMETDYYVTFEVQTLEDKQALGGLIEQVLGILAGFPVESTPGPQPGYVGVTFQAPTDELRLWFTRRDAETALNNGLRGGELFNALQAK